MAVRLFLAALGDQMRACRRIWCGLRAAGLAITLAGAGGAAVADELPEYRLKAAFVYNFIVYTEWPADLGPTLSLCVQGADPFGKEIDALHGKVAGGRSVAVLRRAAHEPLRGCQAVFFAAASIESMPRLLEGVRGQPVLAIADTAGALRLGAALNMFVHQNRVAFEASLPAARAAGLSLSSKLLRLASEVQP